MRRNEKMKKKWMALITAAVLAMAVTACGSKEDTQTQESETVSQEVADTLGQKLLAVFEEEVEANAQASAQELADAVITDELILFSGGTVPVEPGILTGFGNAEITGFKEGVMFAPMIGTIPFVGYVFTLEEGADADGFVQTLTDNADPRWNICTEAEETVAEAAGDKVFFLMCPTSLEDNNEQNMSE